MLAGTYVNDCSFNGTMVRTGASLVGHSAASTVIDCEGAGRFLTFEPAAGRPNRLVLAGLTIRNGKTEGSGGGVLVRGGHLLVRGCRFERDASGAVAVIQRHLYSGGGGAIAVISEGTTSSVAVEGTSFSECGARGAGGAILVLVSSSSSDQYNDDDDSVPMTTVPFRIEGSNFTDCRANSAGAAISAAAGSGCQFQLDFQSSNFTRSTRLSPLGTMRGGVIYVAYAGDMVDVRQLFTALVFTNTSIYAVGSALDSSALGGVLYFGVFGTMTSVYTAFTNCSCVGTLANSSNGYAQGGFTNLGYASATNVTLTVDNMRCIDNSVVAANGFTNGVCMNPLAATQDFRSWVVW